MTLFLKQSAGKGTVKIGLLSEPIPLAVNVRTLLHLDRSTLCSGAEVVGDFREWCEKVFQLHGKVPPAVIFLIQAWKNLGELMFVLPDCALSNIQLVLKCNAD